MSNPILDSQRAKVAKLERDLAHERAVLYGMEAYAASLSGDLQPKARPGVTIIRNGVPFRLPSKTGGGKTPGQLSMAWRGVLEYFYALDLKFTEEDATVQYALGTGKEMRPRDVKRRLLTYADEHRFLEIEPDGRFRVAEAASERFGFERLPKGGKAIDLGEGQTAMPPLFGDREGGEGYRTPTT